jgi:hypothetical protein
MSKLVTRGYTFGKEAHGQVVEVSILSYDNNEFARVRHTDGTEEMFNIGYLFADAKLTRAIPYVNWFIHGGGRRENYKPRLQRKRVPKYHVYGSVSQVGQYGNGTQRRGKPLTFRTKAAAIAFACRQAKLITEPLEVSSDSCSGGSRGVRIGWMQLWCYANGDVVQYGGRLKRPVAHIYKYLRGHGKRFN